MVSLKATVMAKQRLNCAVMILCILTLLSVLCYLTCVSCVTSIIATNLYYCTSLLQWVIVALHKPFQMETSPWLMVAPLLIAL